MSAAGESIASATYALFALEQPVPLADLAAGARESRFPLSTTTTPQWFAAAAHDDYSLLETAPELLVLPTDLDHADAVDVTGIDLIHVYAPELSLGVPEPSVPTPATPAPVHETPRTSTQLGLLRELSELDT